jgi:hypothetical protein
MYVESFKYTPTRYEFVCMKCRLKSCRRSIPSALEIELIYILD